MYINNVLYCFYSSDTEALEACFRLLHDDDDGYQLAKSIINIKFEHGLIEARLTSLVYYYCQCPHYHVLQSSH